MSPRTFNPPFPLPPSFGVICIVLFTRIDGDLIQFEVPIVVDVYFRNSGTFVNNHTMQIRWQQDMPQIIADYAHRQAGPPPRLNWNILFARILQQNFLHEVFIRLANNASAQINTVIVGITDPGKVEMGKRIKMTNFYSGRSPAQILLAMAI